MIHLASQIHNPCLSILNQIQTGSEPLHARAPAIAESHNVFGANNEIEVEKGTFLHVALRLCMPKLQH